MRSRPIPSPVAVAATVVALLLTVLAAPSSRTAAPPAVAAEAAYDPGPISGYAGAPSYALEVYRMGWHGGAGSRLVAAADGLPGRQHPVPAPDPVTGLVSADWPVAYTLQTRADWVSGVYLARLIASTGQVAFAIFVLRDDAGAADVLYQVPLTTYQAYNNWGGKSLYDYNSAGGRAHKVSFDRPYAIWSGAGGFFQGEYNAVRWLEARGYSVKYATSLDLHADPRLLDGSKVFLTSWHDEYWSRPMRENAEAALRAGKHLAFLSSDNVVWQVRFEPSAPDRPNHVMVGYKEAALDPAATADPTAATVRWRDAPVGQPENALLGVMSDGQFDWETSFPWVVADADHWIYAGTGLRAGDQIAGLVGYEYDRVFDNGQTPAGLRVLSHSPVVTSDGRPSVASGAIYTLPGGGTVFSAGTNRWPWKLDDNQYQSHGADPRVQRMTANLLDALTARPATPREGSFQSRLPFAPREVMAVSAHGGPWWIERRATRA